MVVVPQDKSAWSYSEEGDILRRKEYIESYETQIRQSQDKVLSEEDERQKSFVERLGAKVIDNLKINISDIHIRFELDSHRFAAGITLEKIECYTTDSSWQQYYTDRSELEIYKLLNINSLALYGTTNNSVTVSALHDEDAQIAFLSQMIHSPTYSDFVVCPISACGKITHSNVPNAHDRPLYTVLIDLPEVTLRYHQEQFHDTVKLIEYFTEYKKFLLKAENIKKFKIFSPVEKTPRNLWKFAISSVIRTIRQRKDRTFDYFLMPIRVKKMLEQNFKMIHRKRLRGTELTEEEISRYDQTIYITELTDLFEWTSHVLSVVDNEKTPKKSWFSFWNKEDEAEGDYDEIFRDIKNTVIVEQYPRDYVWVDFAFQLQKGVLELVKSSSESLKFQCTDFSVSVLKKMQGTDFLATVWNFSLVANQDLVICTKINTEESLPLCALEIKLHPTDADLSLIHI